MSDTLVPNEVLAFLQYQLEVMDEVSIAQICKTNFTEEEIRSAKSLLYSSLNITDRMPTRRRDEKGERSLQDIIKVFKETDPDDVPTFVAKDLRKLPPVTFDHVDVTRLLGNITSLRSSLKEMELKFEASQSTINDLRAETPIIASIFTSGRDNNNFTKADQFLPYRWDRKDPRKEELTNHVPSASLPFALGARSCIGKKIALIQITELIYQIVNTFDMQCLNKGEVKSVTSQVLVPDQEVKIAFSLKHKQ